MDDFNGEVSRTEVLGIEPGEQALAQSFSLAVAGRAGDTFFLREPVSVSLWSVLVHHSRVAVTLQVDSSRVSLLAPPCNR